MNVIIDKREERHEVTNLLSPADFIKLKEFFKIDESKNTRQEDIVLMDEKNHIRKLLRGTILRVRKTFKDKKAVLQLKLPQKNGDVVKHADELTQPECSELLTRRNLIIQKSVFKALRELGIGNPLKIIGKINTIRSRVPFENSWHAKIILDHVWFTNQNSRCEMRIVTKSKKRSDQVLKEICTLHSIPIVETSPKVEELYTILGI